MGFLGSQVVFKSPGSVFQRRQLLRDGNLNSIVRRVDSILRGYDLSQYRDSIYIYVYT